MTICNKMITVLTGSALLLIFGNCTQFRNPEMTPAYVEIESIETISAPGQGTRSHDIKELYFYKDEEFLGAYAQGKPFPVLGEGPSLLSFFPGIRENAIQDFLSLYPFLDRAEIAVNLEPGKTHKVRPQFRYVQSAKFLFVEDFESAHIFTERLIGPANGRLVIDQTEVYEGSGSGRLEVTKENPILSVATNDTYTSLPRNGAPVFMEINFKSDAYLFIGLKGFDGLTPFGEEYIKILLNPSKEWKKVYIRFNEEIVALRKNGYQFIFRADYDFGNPAENQRVLIDNVKVIYF
jgi:hypothetical protein